ncbi:MAG TPA: DUF4012 domain-containing protein [Anaerolineae bacterium]|nr:DUF4012 domain-containing protein [Anaerolineae bacterium]
MPNSVALETTQPHVKRKRRWPLIVALIIGLILLMWIGLLVRDGLALRADVLALQDYATALPQPVKPADIDMVWLQQHMTSLDDNLSALHSHAGPLLSLTPALGWLPQIGGDVQAAPALLDMALELTDFGRHATATLAPLWPPDILNDQLSLPVVTRLLQVLQPTMTSWDEYLDRAQAARQRIDTARVSSRVRNLLNRYDEVYPLAQTGLELANVAPQLLGADRPRTYLLLFQNEDELRATGGFISAVGRLTIDAGQIISLTVEDSYAIDDFNTPYPDPPAPIRDYMGIDLWVFRDSNWSPDFPIAAQQAISLYTQTRGGTIDGVIALNQQVVEALADGLGPLTVDGQTIANGQAMRDYMRKAWAPSDQSSTAEWMAQRKTFISRTMQALLERLLNGSEVNWSTLGQALNRVLHSRDLLITLADPKLNQSLRRAQLDGSLRSDASDYVMVVDTSMGYNKASTAMQQAMQYTITLATDRASQAELTIVYTNTNLPAAGCKHGLPDYNLNTTYEQLVQQCYWLYRRVLAPTGAELIDASRHPTGPGELVSGTISDGATRVTEEDGKTVFGTFLIVPRGQRVDSHLRYTLPTSIMQMQGDQLVYHLVWQKQSGAAAWPTTVTVVFPVGASLADAQPQPINTTAGSVTFQFDLSTDREITVRLKQK